MLIRSLVALATIVLPRAAEALTLLPIGDGLAAGYHGDGGVHICSYRYALQQLAASNGARVDVVGSALDSSEELAACSRTGQNLSGSHEGHFAATGSDLYKKIEKWTSSPNYEMDQDGRMQRVDIAVLSMGQRDCLNNLPGDDPSSGSPYKFVSQGFKWALWELDQRLPKGTKVLVVPILLPSEGVSDRASECASWVNDKLLRASYIGDNVKVLSIDTNQPDSAFVSADGLFLPNSELQEKIAAAIWAETGAVTNAAPQGPTDSLSELPERVAERRLEGEDSSGEGTGVGTGEGEDEYGYAWCLDNYDQNECFDYYYGYDWCTENYEKDECFDYYYGYDWCVKYYDQSECHDYYYADAEESNEAAGTQADSPEEEEEEEPAETATGEGGGSGSGDEYGYDWCLENYDQDDCFDYYYGYKWCLDYYDDDECYDYYYPTDFDWNEQSNYKWCLNFYLPNDCEARYYPQAGDVKLPNEDEVDGWFAQHKGTGMFGGLFAAASVCGLGYWCYQRSTGYSPLENPHGEGDELL